LRSSVPRGTGAGRSGTVSARKQKKGGKKRADRSGGKDCGRFVVF